MCRNRAPYIILAIVTVCLGLTSRTSIVPKLIYPYLGDVLYSLMFFFIIGFFLPKTSSLKVGILSVLICFTIEFSQLYQADWINQVRNYRLGGLILGFGFLWSDLLSYFIGGLIGISVERTILKRFPIFETN